VATKHSGNFVAAFDLPQEDLNRWLVVPVQVQLIPVAPPLRENDGAVASHPKNPPSMAACVSCLTEPPRHSAHHGSRRRT